MASATIDSSHAGGQRPVEGSRADAPIICFSHLRWDFVTQRPQHLMRRFARGRRVFFFEEHIPCDHPLPYLEFHPFPADDVIVLRPRLPHWWSLDEREAGLRGLLAMLVGTAAASEPVFWFYTPMMFAFAADIPAAAVVYDCMDELTGFRFADPRLVDLETALIARADAVFTGGWSLYEAKRHRHGNIHAFPSAVDADHFGQARSGALAVPRDQSGLPGPVLGFYGVIDERLDLDLLRDVAASRPDWSFVLLGPVAKIDPAERPNGPNLHWLGSKAYDELPAYLSGWDVALMPFAINEATRFISPTKTPEYLAGGRPVVSTQIADVVRHYGELVGVRIASDAAAFVEACEDALALGRDGAWRDEADAALAGLSWDKTQRQMARILSDALIAARSAATRAANDETPATPTVASRTRRESFDTLVVGAGFAGAVLAERLAEGSGQRVLVIDRRDHIGGNAYDHHDAAGVLVHRYGPHIFHTNSPKVVDYLSRFTGWRPYEHRVLARVGEHLLPIPINRTTLNGLYGLDLATDAEAAAFLAARAEPLAEIRTAEDVVVAAVGRELYETFFRGYTLKQWGLDPSQLDRSVTARVPTRTDTDDRYFLDRFQAMPADGYTAMFARMLDHPGITVRTGTEYRSLRDRVDVGHTVFTGPVDEFFEHRFGRLPYRCLTFRHETHDRAEFQPVGVVNYPSPDVPFTRITEYKHLTGQRHDRTSISYEFPCADGDPYYPVPREENQAIYRRYEALARATPDVSFVGRLATYRYYNMDQVVAQALATYAKLGGTPSMAGAAAGAVSALTRRAVDLSPAEPAARRLRLCLATDSLIPSGVGEQMLVLAQDLGGAMDVTVAADPRSGLVGLAHRSGLGALAFDADDPASLRDRLRRWRPDILHVHAGIGWEGHDLAAVGLEVGADVVLRTEHLPFLLTDAAQAGRYLDAVRDLDAVICVSEASAASYIAAGVEPSNIHAIRNGIRPRAALRTRDETRRDLGLSFDVPVLLTVARMTEQKGHGVLLDALSMVRASLPDVVCLLAGEGPLRGALEAQAQAAGLGGAVRFLGYRGDVADLMEAADLFVLPSLFEGLPLVVLEAMAAGRAVVATRIGGTDEAVEDGRTGWLVEPGDAPALAETLVCTLSDREALERAGAAGRERFDTRFQAAGMAEETARLHRRLAASLLSRDVSQDQDMKTIRIGFVGAGGIAHRHLDVLEEFADVEIVGFADVDRPRAEGAAARFGARAFDDAAEMLDACAPDAVYICIPPFAHGAPERACIERGLPFFVEKPVALDIATAEAIAEAVKAKGLVTGVGYHWRYLDTVDEARALLADNPAQLVSGYWLDSTPPPQWWWHEDRSGGQMVEQATHLLDLARFLVGEVSEVYGRAGHKDRGAFPGLDVPTVTTASLTFAGGGVANIASTCLLGWNHRVGLHIFADKLAIELTDRDIMVDVGRGRPVRGADGDPVWREDRDFIDAVAGGENRIRCTYADAVATHRLALAVVESARTGDVVRLKPATAPRAPLSPLRFPPRPEPGALPPGHRHIRSLGIERPGEAYHFQYEEGPPGEGQVRLDTLYTGFSAGTELTFYKNTNPYLHSRWDAGRGVFVPGEAGQHFPVPFLGYMEVARVGESRAPGYAPGDIVASTYAHKSGHTADPFHDLLVKLPAGIDPMLGIYVAQMGPIAANGLLHADAELAGPHVERLGQGVAGRPVLVVGGGVVGLLTALFAARAGAAEIVVADPSPFRRERIEALGFTAMEENQAWNYAKANWHHGASDRGADFVFQTRADAGSLHAALRALRPQGTVIDLAFYQGGAEAVRLGEEFHHNGLSLRCAQINRVPRGLDFTWNRRRLAEETIGLLAARGGDIARHMITHVVPFEEAPAFLRHLVDERPDFLQIVFKVRD